jgi:hypothetical protein
MSGAASYSNLTKFAYNSKIEKAYRLNFGCLLNKNKVYSIFGMCFYENTAGQLCVGLC